MRKRQILLTCGDPAGVGPEIVLKSMANPAIRRLASFCLLGPQHVWEDARAQLGLDLEWATANSEDALFTHSLNLYSPFRKTRPIRAGKWTRQTGDISFRAVDLSIRLCMEQIADGVVTAPICKAAWHAAGYDFPGHTELLAERTRTRDVVMMLTGAGLQVALVTIHIPLKDVPKKITKQAVTRAARILYTDLVDKFGIPSPRIAVLGVNPHAGEEGHMGREEERIIRPAVDMLRKEGIDVTPPLPADTAFFHARNGKYDAILAMYHDQGLGPLKTVAFDEGVNVTLGLPIVRTSVDHGTAFDIAGHNMANPRSCCEAIKLAVRMSRSAKRDPQ